MTDPYRTASFLRDCPKLVKRNLSKTIWYKILKWVNLPLRRFRTLCCNISIEKARRTDWSGRVMSYSCPKCGLAMYLS